MSLVSCGTGDKCFLSPEFEEVRSLMQTDPQTALQKLQELPPSSSSTLYNYEYTILLAEALYKNYLPQSNFDELKAIVESLESEENTSFRLRQAQPAIPNYLTAKAHYYHAVGLNEHDDIVGSCEHYLKALEIMSEIKKPDYEQKRFIFLAYTRLGELFLNENYCDIAMVKLRQALKYAQILNNSNYIANTLKIIGNTYQLTDNIDSALYYFNESLSIGSSLINKLNVEKSIALILFNKGNKDSAYILLKNNLDKIENYETKYSYYTLLGEFYYHDKIYDSAICYLERGFEAQYFYTKLNASMKLSAIYDSLNDNEKKAYYDNITSQMAIEDINKSVDRAKLQTLYDEYKERKNEIEVSSNRRKVYFIICSFLVLAFVVMIVMRYRYRSNHKKLLDDIDTKEKIISDFKDKLEKNNQKLSEIRRNTNNNIDFEAFQNSKICNKILNRKPTEFTALSEVELAQLIDAANKNLGNLTKTLNEKYPELKKEDFYCICLLLLNVDKNKFHYLLGRNRKTIWARLNKIKKIMNIGDDEDLYLFIRNII